MPFLLSKTQLPPTRSEASKQSNGSPLSCSACAPAMPDEPAPMIAVVARLVMCSAGLQKTAQRDACVTLEHASSRALRREQNAPHLLPEPAVSTPGEPAARGLEAEPGRVAPGLRPPA